MRFPPISATPDKFDRFGNKLCRNCDELVGKGRRHYCSKNCLWEFTENHTWSLVRLAVLRRDKYRCGICAKRKGRKELDIDHIIPVRMGIDPFEKKNLRALCKECHKKKTKLDASVIK